MEVQYLNGIDIQYLNGSGEYEHTLDAKKVAAINKLNRKAKHDTERKRRVVAHMTKGLSNSVADKAAWVASGKDFANFEGNGSIADDERIRTYLQNTLEVAQEAPMMVAGYQNPEALCGALGYVLKQWDTPNREQAIDNMIAEEERQMAMGGIDANIAEDHSENTMEDLYDIDNYDVATYVHGLDGVVADAVKKAKAAKKNGLFKAVKKALKPTLTTDAQDVVAANPATKKRRTLLRDRIKQFRTADAKQTEQAAQITGVYGEDDIDILMAGTDLEYKITGENPLDCFKRYLLRTKKVAVETAGEFDTPEQAKQVVVCIDTLMTVWDNPRLRERVFNQIETTAGLDGFLKKAIKKVAKAVKTVTVAPIKATVTVTKKAAQAVAKVAKKVGKAVAKVAKKVWKLVVRFNPLTLLIRAGILGFCRLNMFKVANKCYIGSLTKDAALKKGATEDEWKKSNEAYGHLKNAYTKLGGKESKLKSTLEKGNKKKWTGTEYPTDGNAIKDASKNISAADDKEAQADMDYDETVKEYQSKGYISDSTVSADTATVTKQEEVTIIENERTTKDATKLYEGDDKAKVLVTIPKAAKVLVDVKETSNGLIACTYNGKNGWVEQSGLAGLGACDAESCAILGLYGIIEDQNGLGEPATATAIASASATIASIMAKIKNIFGKAKEVVSTAKNVVSTVKDTKDAVKSGDVEKVLNNVTTVASNPSLLKTSTPATATTTNPIAQKISNVVSTVKNVASQGAAVVSAIKNGGTVAPTTYEETAQPQAQAVVNTATVQQAVQPTAQSAQNNTKKYLLIGGGVAVAGLLGYLLLRKKD